MTTTTQPNAAPASRHACPTCKGQTIRTPTHGHPLIYEGQPLHCLHCGLEGIIGLDADHQPYILWKVQVSDTPIGECCDLRHIKNLIRRAASLKP